MRIPYGATVTYAELAASAGSPRAVRAAGQACATNPIAIIGPCHRVLGGQRLRRLRRRPRPEAHAARARGRPARRRSGRAPLQHLTRERRRHHRRPARARAVQDHTDLDALRERLERGADDALRRLRPDAPTACTSATSCRSCCCAASSSPGHLPIALAGGATGMVGDPGGRSEERNLLDGETLDRNTRAIKAQLSAFLDFEPGPVPGAPGRQPRLDRADRRARLPARRRQAHHGQLHARQGVGAQPRRERARHLVHRVQLHAAAGQRLRLAARAHGLRAAGRRLRPVGQHHRRHRARAPARRRVRARPHACRS